jgi:hypothetical protein
MTEEKLIQAAGAAVRELSNAIVNELTSIRTEIRTESAMLENLEADALRAAVSAAKVWMRIRLGREVTAAEIGRKVG